MTPPICALCNRAMQPVPEAPGVWRCPVHETHEFHEDGDAEPLPDAGARRVYAHFGVPCPRCRGDMKPVPHTSQVWRCVSDPAHEFMAIDRAGAVPRPSPQQKPAGKTALMVTAAPYWLAHLGLTGPIRWAPQSNVTDGRRCLLTGPVAPGGGSKSGRRRKKTKGGKTFTDSAWGEGGTNSR